MIGRLVIPGETSIRALANLAPLLAITRPGTAEAAELEAERDRLLAQIAEEIRAAAKARGPIEPVRRYCAICQGAPGVFVCGPCFQRAGLHQSAVDPSDTRVVARYQHGGELGGATHRPGVDLDAPCPVCGRRGTFHVPGCTFAIATGAAKRSGTVVEKGASNEPPSYAVRFWVRVRWDVLAAGESPAPCEVTVDDTTFAQAEPGRPIALSVVDWNPGSNG